MKQYVDGLIDIIRHGRRVEDRTGTGTISLFGDVQSVYYMKDGFPSLGLKNNWWKGIYHELLWFLDAVPEEYKKFGNTNIKYLVDHGVGIWNEWPYEAWYKHSDAKRPIEDFVELIRTDDEFALKWGDLGPVYGKQWMDWGGKNVTFQETIGGSFGGNSMVIGENTAYAPGFNQIKTAIKKLAEYPDDRGNVVSAWNVGELNDMALRPCHTMFQMKSEPLTKEERHSLFIKKASDIGSESRFNSMEEVSDEEMDSPAFNIPKRRLSLKMYQRSADYFLGVPFNIASYSCLLHMIAHVTNQVPHKFIHTFGDAHIYSNHYDQVNELLSRTYGKENPIFDFVGDPMHSHEWLGADMGPKLPEICINPEIKNIEDFRYEDIKLKGYTHYGSISAPVAV